MVKSCRDKTDDLDALSVLFSTAGYSMDTVFVALFATTVEVVSCKKRVLHGRIHCCHNAIVLVW